MDKLVIVIVVCIMGIGGAWWMLDGQILPGINAGAGNLRQDIIDATQ